ncbi:MAG: rod shape-determining protein MreD [Patescibacteria group bacterium]
MKQVLSISLLLYALALLQMSFLVYFFPNGLIPNFIIFTVVFLGIFEKRESYTSIGAALFGGFLMDIFSGGIMGFWSFVLTLIALLLKVVLEDYVRLPIPKKF